MTALLEPTVEIGPRLAEAGHPLARSSAASSTSRPCR